MNLAVLVGRMARDPELRYTQSQTAVCTATIAVNRPKYKDNEKDEADFIRLTLFGKQAETFAKYLKKGQQVAVQGSIRTGSYENKNGDKVYTSEVTVNRFDFIGNNNKRGHQTEQQPAPAYSDDGIPEGFEAIDEDDIPFL